MALATGGTAVGDTTTRSRPISCALRRAAAVGITSAVPSGNTARTSRNRMDSFTFSRRLGLRGGKFRPGYMFKLEALETRSAFSLLGFESISNSGGFGLLLENKSRSPQFREKFQEAKNDGVSEGNQD